jgi:hypothetical protein
MTWSTVTLEVTTPLFNAGHAPHTGSVPVEDAEIRIPSLLGAMRFWFRALAGAVVGDDLKALHRWENRVFGRAVATGDQSATSPLQWRIRAQPDVTPVEGEHKWLPSTRKSSFRQGNDRWLVYLLGQGLGDASGCTVRRPYIAPGKEIPLQFRIRRRDDAALALNLASLWLLTSFGGIGARTRRGFGGVRIASVELAPDVPSLWSKLLSSFPKNPAIQDMQCLWCNQIDYFITKFVPLTEGPSSSQQRQAPHKFCWTQAPEYPVIGMKDEDSGRHVTAASLGPGFRSWNAALGHAGLAWRTLRATEPAPDARYPEPKAKTREWKKVVHGNEKQFNIGAYGLPIVFKDNIAQVMIGEEKSRRASPVWMRPVKIDGMWRVFSFAFLTRLLPEDGPVAVTLDRKGKPSKHLILPEEFDIDRAKDWFEELNKKPG